MNPGASLISYSPSSCEALRINMKMAPDPVSYYQHEDKFFAVHGVTATRCSQSVPERHEIFTC